jgi:hypothetical protein
MKNKIYYSLIVICCAAAALAIQETQKQPPSDSTVRAGTRPKTDPIPDRYVNLQVLPRNIAKPQLIAVMKQFSITFNVRCSYCHAVSDDLTEGPFESDEKETKRKARELLKLVYEVNSTTPSEQPKSKPN